MFVEELKKLTDVMILKIFLQKKSVKKLSFLTLHKAKLCKKLIITLVFEKNANYFAENCQNRKKIVIITSTSGLPEFPGKLSTGQVNPEFPDPLFGIEEDLPESPGNDPTRKNHSTGICLFHKI
jgi:hypothetical protein